MPRIKTWTFTDQKTSISQHDRLRFKVGCPGLLTWSVDGWKEVKKTTLLPSGGVVAGLNIYAATLGPYDETTHSVEFFFTCQCAPVCRCAPDDLCCDQRHYTVRINSPIG